MSKLSKYISWNEALLDYFVRNGSSVWYVTDSVIEHIGKQYEIRTDGGSYTDDFVNTVFSICENGIVSKDSIYNNWFRQVNPIPLSILEGENDGCTEDNLNLFIEHNKTITDVYEAFKLGRLSQLCDEIDIHHTQFYQVVEACIEDFEDRSLNRPLYQISNNKQVLIQVESLGNIRSILDFALFLTGKEFYYSDFLDNKHFAAPYFSYLILLLLGFNQSNNQTWEEVERLFGNYGLSLSQNERPKVERLFRHAIQDGLLNNSCTRTPDRYVKYLKYHSVLTPGRREVLESVLYDHNIALTEGLKFNDIRNWIWRVSSRTALNQFKDELLRTENASYFLEIIKSFDREVYRERRLNAQNNQNTGADRQDGHFRFVIDAETQSLSVWVEGIKVNQVLSNGNIKITPNYILPNNYIADVPNLSWGGYAKEGLLYKETGICIKSVPCKSCYYFEIVNSRWMVEVTEPDRLVGKRCYFITREIEEGFLRRVNAIERTDWLTFFLPNGWHLYYIASLSIEDIGETKEEQESLNTLSAMAHVVLDDAIRVNVNGKLCFLAEMFPYIIYEGIEYNKIKIKAFDSIDKHPISFKRKNIGNKIYLYDIAKVQSGEMILEIYDEQDNRIDYNVKEKSHFQVRSACDILAYNDKEYVKFDEWFCLTNDEEAYYSNNRVYPLANTQISWEPTTQQPVHSEHQSYSRMMAVLYALGETRGHNGRKAIPNSVLESVLKYEADFNVISLDKFQMYRLKNALCELGVLTHYYDGGHYYQTNSACLIPTGKRYVENAADGKGVSQCFYYFYILSGAYSKTDYEKVICSAKYVEYVQQHDPLYSLLPPVVKVGFKDKDESSLSIPVNKDCTYGSLLGFAGIISDLHPVISSPENTTPSPDENAENVPCIVPSMDYRGRREQLRIDNERIMVNPDFPLPLLRNYANYMHNIPLWFESRGGEIFIEEEKAIPFYAKRALNSFSGNLSKEVYVFGVDDIIGNGENHLFERLITYVLPTGGAKTNVLNLLKNVLGGKNANIKSVYVPSDVKSDDDKLLYGGFRYIKMLAYKKEESGINKWWLELLCGGKVICYTDPDTREVYCAHDDQFKRINLNDKSINSIVSKVIKIYDEKYNFTVQEFYPNYGISIDNTDVCQNYPSCETEATKYEIIILKSYEK